MLPKPPMMLAANAFNAMSARHADGDEQDRRHQDAGKTAQRGAVGEGDQHHQHDGNAEQAGHFLVLASRLQLLAEQRLLEDQVLQGHQHGGD